MLKKIFAYGKYDDEIRYVSNITRFLSIMIDLVILICILLFFSYLTFTLIGMFYSVPLEVIEKVRFNLEITGVERNQLSLFYLLTLIMQIVQLAVICLYITFMWCKFGTTPAKFLFGIRIVDANTFQKITFKQAQIRFFSIIVSVLPLCLGIIWSIFDSRSQTWHDKISNTVLIVKSA
ncbi:MAG: RDD family protein [Rickettsiaceae bacterium H1]|nr:RDD family protein [Rickettsiaceae bacterium H1]